MEYINRFYWLIALCLIISTGANASVNPKPFVIPELKEWKGSDGTFVPTEATKIVYAANNPELERIARIFAQDYQTMFGRSLEVVQGKGAAGDFIFSLRADKKLGKEGYTIRVTDRVALSAPENIGVYWGTRTLLQIAEQSENHQLPKGTLRDYPDYPLRGFMIDCGRKFIPLSYLQDYVKTMSYYKMNTLQIHLNDNGFKQYFEHDWSKTYAAFRLECDTYPGLTARDGHYTKKEFVDLQKLAEQSYVEIIPEIDIPAHSLAFSHYKPELGSKEYGMDHLDLFNPEVYTFFDALFKEYLEGEEPVFRGNKVHVGTDEYSNAKKEVVEKFRAFTDHYIRYIESFGKQACVWGALTHAKGDTPVKSENVIMNAWYNGYADPKEMIKQGYHLISIPDGHYTKKEFVDLQKLAEQSYVEIIPEIDIPAHSLAFSHYKPELGSKEYGMDHLDLFNPEVYTFFDALFKEYLEGEEPVFRGNKVHVGTDEYSNAKKEVVEKFRAFTDHYIRYIESFGKQACVWGALTHAKGDTPVKSENVIMNAWYNGYADPKEMIKQGYHLISIPDGLVYIVPQAGYYYDYLNTKSLYEKWTPAQIGKAVFEEKDPNILGGMFAVWNDHVGNGISNKDIHHRVYPALQTLAVKMWTGKQVTTPYDSFNEQRNLLSEAPGVNQLGRIGKAPGLVYEQAAVTPNRTLPYREIGYNYLVSFDIKGADEAKGTELFRSPDAVFYLSDPISGMLGFARDGYLNTFNYRIMPGEHATVGISGDNRVTRLHINGKIVEELNIQKRFYNGGKDSMNYVRTLVFPLQETGNFKSQITNLKVYRQ